MMPQQRNTDTDYDKFYTPPWPVRLLLDNWSTLDASATIAEPCAGDGSICKVLDSQGYDVITGDVSPDPALERWCESVKAPMWTVDARDPDAEHAYTDGGASRASAVVTNPPYSASTGTAGDVMESIVSWGLPTAALLRITWLEPCQDRVWAWLADQDAYERPTAVWVLPRVEYDWPDKDKDRNPATSMWVIWEPLMKDRETPLPVDGTTLKVFGSEAKAKYMGQESLLEVAE